MKTFKFYKAIDKIDGGLSLFVFDEEMNYTVVPYSEDALEALIKEVWNGGGCHWSNNPRETPRFDDMVDPVLIGTMFQ